MKERHAVVDGWRPEAPSRRPRDSSRNHAAARVRELGVVAWGIGPYNPHTNGHGPPAQAHVEETR